MNASPGSRRLKRSAEIESVDVDKQADYRLDHAEDHQRDVMAALPETPTEARDDDAGHGSQYDETENVIAICYVVAADCSRCQQVTEQASDEQGAAERYPERASSIGGVNAHTRAELRSVSALGSSR